MAEVDGELATALRGRYEIERELGHGGMAVVYLARDVRHGRLVAIKVLPAALATALGAERFLREISIAARLTHPNILPLHESIADGRILAYVMPYVEGESLAERLKREHQLPIDEAVSIARQVAAALEYSHTHGVVHRDVKPENVMLVGEQVLLADFGLARALQSASSAPLTGSGIAVGTPSYMSPEQATADHDVDGRTDVYALGCVLYEMIVGTPPFSGATAQAVIAQHVTRPPPSLCAERASCPEGLDAAVRRAMAKVPADRFRSAADFSRAIAGSVATPVSMPAYMAPPARAAAHRRRWLIAAGALLGALGLVAVAAARHSAGATADGGTASAARYVVLPFSWNATPPGGALRGAEVGERLSDAFGEWQGVTLIDSRRAAELGRGGGSSGIAEALSAARSLGATRVVLGELSAAGTGTAVRATLYDATSDTVLRTRAVRIDSTSDAQAYRVLANALLREGTELPWTGPDDHRPASLPAWQRYDEGRAALARWDLATATDRFHQALALDGDHAPAQLWLAQAGAWAEPDRRDLWRDAASRAVAAIDRFTPDDTLVARGAYALSLGRYPEACAAYATLHAAMPKSPIAWLGLGQCQMMDDAVVRDARSPSGWRFRSSFHSAALAYDSAIHRAVGTPAFAFRALDRLLFTQPWRIRDGRAIPPDTLALAAYPTLVGDTLALVPWPRAEMAAGAVRFDRSMRTAALRTNGRRLGLALEEWTRRDTSSADAREVLARLQEVRGDEDGDGLIALRTVADARRLSTDSLQRLELAITQLRLLVKTSDFARARTLADSLLTANAHTSGSAAVQLAGVAALLGRVDEAARLLQQTAAFEDSSVPPAVATLGARYLALAAPGICNDELRQMDGAIDQMLQRYVADDVRPAMRRAVVERPQSLAVPCLGASVTLSAPATDPLTRMQQALARGRPADVRHELDALTTVRAGIRAGDVSLDRTYLEAWVLAQIGDTAAAVRRLDLTLTALPTLGTMLVRDVPQAAAVGRAMALRADLAAASGDSATARRWAQDVVALWSGASPALSEPVARMKSLAAAPRPPAAR